MAEGIGERGMNELSSDGARAREQHPNQNNLAPCSSDHVAMRHNGEQTLAEINVGKHINTYADSGDYHSLHRNRNENSLGPIRRGTLTGELVEIAPSQGNEMSLTCSPTVLWHCVATHKFRFNYAHMRSARNQDERSHPEESRRSHDAQN